MLTIFCSPKPFRNESDWNQRNALRSWRTIHPEVEILVFGTPPGAAEAAAEIKAVLVPEIECSPSGSPLFNAMEGYAAKHGRYDLQVYVNCDILLNATLVGAMRANFVRFGRFLMVGERLDLAKGAAVDVRNPDWSNTLGAMVANRQLASHGPNGVDYFGFTRGTWEGLPLVYMGRSLCDQALLQHCLKQQIPIIDSSESVVAIHQFHDYAHVRGGKQEVENGDDWAFMAREHHLYHSLPTIADADWKMAGDGRFVQGRRRRLRQWELALRYRCRLDRIAYVLRGMQYLGGKRNLQPNGLAIDETLASWHKFLMADSHETSAIPKSSAKQIERGEP